MSFMVMNGAKNYQPSKERHHFHQTGEVQKETLGSNKMPSPDDFEFVLPASYVSIPQSEEGYITLRQQSVKSRTLNEQQDGSIKKWHNKATRRNISKAKDLVLFIGGLKQNLTKCQYMAYAAQCTKVETKSTVGPIFPNLGCFFITFLSGTSCCNAMKLFRLTRFCGRLPELCLLPFISMPLSVEEDHYNPLLVFINCKSGGGQGHHLAAMMEQILNPCQVFLMEKGGALPGLYAFRKLPKFRILVCGGDGTIGWVLSHLEEVQRHLTCSSPPIGILPLGTGNDLARVLGFGAGWEGGNVTGILALVQDTHPVQLDRWNIMFDSSVDVKPNSPDPLLLSDAVYFGKDGAVSCRSISPVNVIMSIGGGSNIDTPVLDQRAGVRNLVTATLPSVSEFADQMLYEEDDVLSDEVAGLSKAASSNGKTIASDSTPPNNREDTGIVSPNSSINEPVSGSNNFVPSDISSGLAQTKEESSDDSRVNAHPVHNSTQDFTRFESTSGDSPPPLRLHRSEKSRNSAKNRLVHILSDSDLVISDQFSRVNEENDEEAHWREKINSLRLSDNFDRDDSDSSSLESSEGTELDQHISAELPEEKLDSIDEETTMAHQATVHQHKLPIGKHQRVASDSHVMIDKNRLCRKQLSMPATCAMPCKHEPANDVKLLVMSNYFGIGIDAELTLAFHLAREENPEKCKSRFRNKALYFKAGLKKMTSRSVNLNHVIELQVDGDQVVLPSIRGLIFLNISSWGSGANAWGSAASKRFRTPSFGDGSLEIIGVSGVAHMGQMYSGIRNGIRIAQGQFIRMTLKAEVAAQVDGEPWMQPPGEIVISASPLQATMLKRNKKRSK